MLNWLDTGTDALFRRRYAILFYTLLMTLAASPILSALKLDAGFLQVFVGLNLLVAALGATARRPSRTLIVIVSVVLLSRLAAALLHSETLATVSLALWTLIGLLAAAGAVRFAMRGIDVGTEHLYGALSAYLLAGVFFGVIYLVVDRTWPGSFAYAGAPLGAREFSSGNATYFSFVTLATLGYGDFLPLSDVARGLAVLEAVVGQLYLAVMVARLVSLYVQRGPSRS